MCPFTPLIFRGRYAIYILQSNASYANFNRHNIRAAPARRARTLTIERGVLRHWQRAIETPLVHDGIK